MKSPEDNTGAVKPSANDQDELTGLPGLKTWRHVYLFVFSCFVLWVLLLLGLTVFYS